jgi:hypothetical protein
VLAIEQDLSAQTSKKGNFAHPLAEGTDEQFPITNLCVSQGKWKVMNPQKRWILLGVAWTILFLHTFAASPTFASPQQPSDSITELVDRPDLPDQPRPQSEPPSQQGQAQQQQQQPLTQTDQKDGNNDPNEPITKSKTVTQNGPNDRLFWTLPNFLTVENAAQVPPLTAKEKFKLVTRGSFDYVEYPYIGFLSGISQAENSEPGYGQGAAGYAKRYGAAFADNTDENYWTGAILPSLLHDDPRYYQLGKGGFFHRVGYAVSRELITRTDSGHNTFNVSEVAGAAIAAGISNAYHPAGDRTLSNTVSVWWTQIGWDTVSTVVKEFWPDIRRALRKPKEQ